MHNQKKYPVEDDYKDDDDGLKGKILQIKTTIWPTCTKTQQKELFFLSYKDILLFYFTAFKTSMLEMMITKFFT